MEEFSLEKISEKIHYGKTKEYFQEVLSSYQNENYRSSVVMLWSVAICDIIYKLQYLIDLYNDSKAREILNHVSTLQNSDPKSSSWEIILINQTFEKTNLLESSEHENLLYLLKQRHLSAHPVLNQNRELHSPNKETVRALLRNTLEGLLIKPPFYTKKIFNELLDDIAENTGALNTEGKIKQYIESRYLNRLTPEVELEIFESMWKFVFKLENDNCNTNRLINLSTLKIIGNRNKSSLSRIITAKKDFFSNIASSGDPLDFLIYYLAQNDNLYELLNEDAHIKISHCIETTKIGKLCGWFIKENIEVHYNDLISWIESDEYPIFEKNEFDYLLKFSDTIEWQNKFCNILSTYYGESRCYNDADSRFNEAISPFLDLFNNDTFIFLLEKIESNNQVYGRGGANNAHEKIKIKINEITDDGFDFSQYPHLS